MKALKKQFKNNLENNSKKQDEQDLKDEISFVKNLYDYYNDNEIIFYIRDLNKNTACYNFTFSERGYTPGWSKCSVNVFRKGLDDFCAEFKFKYSCTFPSDDPRTNAGSLNFKDVNGFLRRVNDLHQLKYEKPIDMVVVLTKQK